MDKNSLVIRYQRTLKCDVEMSDEFICEGEITKNNFGIYFFYDKNKELIYIGKSISTLFGRMISSSYERWQALYFSYAVTKSKGDVGIYEMYYISKLQPKLNKDGNVGIPTVSLPKLSFSAIKPLYKIMDKPSEYTKLIQNNFKVS